MILINTVTWKYFWNWGCLESQVKMRGKKLYDDEERWAPAEEVAIEGWWRVVNGVPAKYYYYYGVPAKAPIQCKITMQFLLHYFCRFFANNIERGLKEKGTSSRICSRRCPRRTACSPCPTGQITWWSILHTIIWLWGWFFVLCRWWLSFLWCCTF